MRIISLAVGVLNIPETWLYPAVYAPLLVAAVVVVRILKNRAINVGLRSQRLGWQLIVGEPGIILAFAEYPILRPEPIIASPTWHQVWLPALILLMCTGFVEEFVFGGVIQYGAVEAFGAWGIVYVGLLSAILYIGFLPVIWVAFAFTISLYFGWVVKETKSILGVALAHGICNVALYLIVPFL